MHLLKSINGLLALLLCALPLVSVNAIADDIDIFVAPNSANAVPANVLIVLDNTSNWSANNQGWPGGITQGQAEVNAISQVIGNLNSNINVGLMVLTTVSGNPGGMVVFGVKPMTDANKSAMQAWLTARYNNITDSTWKASSNANYGATMFDVFKYFGGYTSPAHATDNVAGTPVDQTHFGVAHYASIPTGILDSSAYDSSFTNYVPPTANPCAKNYIIFIGNGFPNADDTTLLSNVSGNTTPVTPNTMDGGSKVYTADEWARFLYMTDVNSATGQQNVVTYTLNVFGTSPGPKAPVQANYLSNMAHVGGGKYFSAQNANDVLSALDQVFTEIQGVNSTFASASLPVNATNRAQDENQVFIGMFRPDPNANPRWMGNMKRFQLINSGNDLGDANGNLAINPQTGFLTPCATSFWTTDSGTYWSNVTENPSPIGTCPASSTTYDKFSDAPDGPIVEKGAVAEVIRKGNNPPATNTTPTWAVNRTIYTLSKSALTAFNTTSSGLSASIVNYTSGMDVNDENGNGNTTETRPSIHGDVIHSRPLPVNYGGTNGVVAYYGTNDGMFRAVDAATGKEKWTFLAPEFFSKLQRLENNSPLVNYPSMLSGITPTPVAKDYFFDGSIGIFQDATNSNVWIYPSMRRGGRMIYALNVTNPNSPVFKWKAGCPDLTDDTGCTSGFTGIGQTWSIPSVALVKGFSKTSPVIIVGGGYDNCEDADTSAPACSSAKGAGVYVINADTGALIASFPTTRSVAADISMVDVDADGYVDYAYVADTGGNIYRIDFINSSTKAPLASTDWAIHRIAYTNGSGRKFLYGPALLPTNSGMFLAIGSGDREHPLISEYPYKTPVTNRFYVFFDNFSTTAANLDDETVMTNNTSNTTCDGANVLPTGSKKGWFMDLTQNGVGEQTVTSAVIASGMITFSTNRPVPASENSCTNALGEARGYWVNLLNGSGAIGVQGSCGGDRSSTFVGGGLPPSPVIGTVPINGKPTTVVIGAIKKDGTNSSPISPQHIKPAISSKRRMVYWKSATEN